MQIIAFYTLCIITPPNNKPISNQQRLRWFLYCGFTQLPSLQPIPTPRRPRSETQIIKNEFSTKFLHLPSDPHSSHSAGTSKARQYEIFPILIRVPHFIFDKRRNWGGGLERASVKKKPQSKCLKTAKKVFLNYVVFHFYEGGRVSDSDVKAQI